jgi:hypothetical protein
MSKLANKTELVKKHLLKHKTITSWQAIQLYKATRLSAIIFNLKDKGMNIETEMIRKPDEAPYGLYKLL